MKAMPQVAHDVLFLQYLWIRGTDARQHVLQYGVELRLREATAVSIAEQWSMLPVTSSYWKLAFQFG